MPSSIRLNPGELVKVIDGKPAAVLKPGTAHRVTLPAGKHEFATKVKFKMFATGLLDKAFAGRDNHVAAKAKDPAEESYQLTLDLARHALSLPGVSGLHITDFRHDGSVGRLVGDLGIAREAHSPSGQEKHAHGSQLAG